ncbi:MAG TPA: hypothetical protein DD671_16245 [Balneolaceae bacterium]|nr:hypothetical protein [Balneolaceae bacterium]
MRTIAFYIIISAFIFSGCKLLQPKSVSINDSDLENNSNLVEASPDYYLEFIGLKNYTAQQVVDSMRAKQGNTITGAKVLNACSAVMQRDLGFEYSSSKFVNPNYGYITLIESKPDYGVVEKSLPKDSLAIIEHWFPDGKDISDPVNKFSMNFYLQFLRTDGEKLSMKYKLIYNKYATEEEREFTDGILSHINQLDMSKELPLARETLRSDGNLANRYMALIILMRSMPTNNDLGLIFEQYFYNDNHLKSFSTYVLRESIKLRPDFDWSNTTHSVRNLINGAAVHDYDTILKILTDNNFSPELADQVLDPRSPILQDYLNAYESSMSEKALNLIKQLSGDKVNNKKEANQWLASQYHKVQK